jgi:hypothetical protein
MAAPMAGTCEVKTEAVMRAITCLSLPVQVWERPPPTIMSR